MTVGIRLDHISKTFRGGVEAIRDVTLDVEPGEFVVLVGPSGCGKSTLLRVIAGLEEVSSGRVYLGDDDVTTRLPQQRDVAMVFQSYALYPRMTVRRNLGFGLRMRRLAREQRDQRVNDVAEVLGLEHLLGRRPAALSGGQRQRVAIAAALILEPELIIADEPVSMLDVSVRAGILALLDQLRREGLGVLMITHDLSTAAHYADRIAVMHLGKIVEEGPARRVVRDPRHPYTRALISAVPNPDPLHRTAPRILTGGEEVPHG